MSASPSVPPSSPTAVAAVAPGLDGRGFAAAFSLTWLSYATYYLGRKGLSVAKTSIESAFGERALWGVETGYLAMYAVGQFLCGGIGDRTGARRLIGFGMLASAGVRLTALGIQDDILYGPRQVRVLTDAAAAAGVATEYRELRSDKGHDAFLVEWDQLTDVLREALEG